MESKRFATIAVLLLATAKFALHMIYNSGYDFFRDEFDYLSCSEHLDWGFVDHPPLIPVLVKISRVLFGDSLRAVRLVPALASSLIVIQAAALARLMGGGAFARILTAVCVAGAPIYLSDGSLMTTNCLEPLLWMGCVYFALRAVQEDRPLFWLGFGLVGGLGLEEKYSIGILLVGLSAGLLMTPARRWLLHRMYWAGALVAALVFLPNVIWNIQHHWPFFELIRNLRADGRDVVLPPLKFIAEQILLVHPVAAPVWLAGLAGLFFWKPLAPYRFLGWAYLFVFGFFLMSHGKNYYLAPVYPMLFAAGGVVAAAYLKSWMKPLSIVMILGFQVVLIPIVVPVIPVERLGAFLDSLPFEIPRSEVSHASAALPQHYADQFGWRELAALTAEGWKQVPEAERADCAIFAQNYGQAGAIDFFGKQYGLPAAISGHQSYFLWGPRNYTGKCMLVIGDRQARLMELFDEVTAIGTTDAPYALENRISVALCRSPKLGSLSQWWPKVKKWR